ncbi:class I SAM-dependent methyltransferase [Thermaerobacillus caldiproteolyticus]|uniref:SAM-dependent MidA family methyltransferase n=1 Tax=Thermaerobacillus caldiproteolyticus TaxID=247480 RepID=A0A7V9Z3W6_9BACL|nr:SAM-dependent methyltransferase [Anoxybacillus caldiproteolyticus]MBA2873465.1 SAM-dependent MidA family methyltransferase [Anoxybacillus caldiproteolyticus]
MGHDIYTAIRSMPQQRMSYADYMRFTLYDEKYGYYMRNRIKIGRFGDFITSSHLSNVFGKLFASLFIRLVETEEIRPCICELGGGDGKFARAVLEEWKETSLDTYETLTYVIIETSPYQRKKQMETLGGFSEKVVQYKDISEFQQYVSRFSGIVFSNEFFDAFPVHVITKENGKLYELFVALHHGQLIEEKQPLQNEDILCYLRERNISLVDGQRFEVPLAMKSFIMETASLFESCVMFTVDYGYSDEEWQLPARRHGSLRGYYQHQLVPNPLAYPGEMDITAHVQWNALRMYGERAGWEWVTTMRQDRFLLAAGILHYLVNHHDVNPFSERSRQNRAIRSLITDEGMSVAFQVMVQQKGIKINWENIWIEPNFL